MIPISRRYLVVCGTLAAFVVTISARGDEPRHSIAETDLFRFVWAGDPEVAPDGSTVAFVRVTVDRDKDERLQHIVNWFDKYLLDKPMPQYDLPGSEDKAQRPAS